MSSRFPELFDDLRALKRRVTAKEERSWCTFFPEETTESLAAIERSTGFPVPPCLEDFLLTFGGFCFHMHVAGFALTFRALSPYPHPFGGLAALLDARWCWADWRDAENFPEEAIARLNANFVCFGHCDIDENAADHFFYDRNGHFGVLRFDQDFRDDDAFDYLHELCKGVNKRAPLTLEEVLTKPLRYCLRDELDDDLD